MRDKHDIPRLFGVFRGEFLTHTLSKSGVSMHENRNVGTQRQAQCSQAIMVPAQLPQVIEAQQRGGGIRTATPDSAAHGQNFIDPDIHSQRTTGLLLKFFRCPHDQIAVVGHTFKFGVQLNHAVVADGEGQFIAVVEKLKQRLQLVIAVFTATENVQHQIEFGRGGQREAF
ncbi:hypothetical protein AO262_01475 [Pseudomonas fluorescens ABAC62]|nr:hypothetical protein AO262_01475 [Pseudomonas fluorescens ABAC62]